LAEQGVGKELANKARKMAGLTTTEVNAVVSRDKTLAAVTREKTAKVREKRLSLPDAKYRVVYADPPWQYNDKADTPLQTRGGFCDGIPPLLAGLPLRGPCRAAQSARRSTTRASSSLAPGAFQTTTPVLCSGCRSAPTL
jgi:hypothetical protein